MWHPTETTIEEKEHLFSFMPMAESLDNVNKPPICVEPQPLKAA